MTTDPGRGAWGSGPPTITAYDDHRGTDPHAIRITVTQWPVLTDAWQPVEDATTDQAWLVRRADCGLGCRCAAEAIPVDEWPADDEIRARKGREAQRRPRGHSGTGR